MKQGTTFIISLKKDHLGLTQFPTTRIQKLGIKEDLQAKDGLITNTTLVKNQSFTLVPACFLVKKTTPQMEFNITQHHLVMPNELNHVGTLFGGEACSLADRAGFICASLAYTSASFVTRHFEPFNFLAPAKLGDILTIHCSATKTGLTSVTVKIHAVNAKTDKVIFSTKAVFVNVKEGVKAPIDCTI